MPSSKTKERIIITIIISAVILIASSSCYYFVRNHAKFPTNTHFDKLGSTNNNFVNFLAKKLQLLLFMNTRPASNDLSEFEAVDPPPTIHAAGFCIKKIGSKVAQICGEDAFLVRVNEDGFTFLGVADGVGGWGEAGGDSSKISTGLLAEINSLLPAKSVGGSTPANEAYLYLKDTIQKAYNNMVVSKKHRLGSTTLTSVLYNFKTGHLDFANLGDSGAMLFRDRKLIFKTKIGVESFNAPHQVGFDQFGNAYGDIQKWLSTQRLKPKRGDLLILASDGLLDNVFDEEVAELSHNLLVTARSGKGMADNKKKSIALLERLGGAATTLAWHSFGRSTEKHWISPFSQAAVSSGFNYVGGKQDDITVVVALFD